MYKIEIKTTALKQGKEIDEAITKIMADLQAKLAKQNKAFEYSAGQKNGAITFSISSQENTATELIVQFDKQVREVLGKQHKTAIKPIEIIDYEIEAVLEQMPKKELVMPFAKKTEFADNKIRLVYENLDFENLKAQYVEKTIKLVKERIKMQNYEGKDEFKEYVWEGKQKKVFNTKDPAVELEEKNWIKRTDAKGQFVYGREFTALMNTMKELMIEHVYAPLEFYEMTFPKFEPWAVPMKSGHAKNIYPNAYFVCVPKKSSPEEWQDVMDYFEITGEVPEEKIRQRTVCAGIMSYAQCPPFWPFLKNRVIDETTLPLLVYDWSGPTYRNESGGTHGLDRVEEFNRVETLFVGTKEQVIKVWKDLKEAYIHFYDGVLDLEMKAARVTPWWMAHAGVKNDAGSEEVGTFDFDIYLPYRGDREEEWLEVQNVSSNGEKYPKAFSVKGKSHDYLWSGCAGTSFQRIIVAFLAQKGLDTKNWPEEVRVKYEQKIKGIKDLKFF